MEINSQKLREWVGIINELDYKFTTAHVHVLLFKGLTHLLCLAPILLCFALPCLVYSTLAYPILSCLALPYPTCPTLPSDVP